MRNMGLSAFVRCTNEEEYIVASLLSAYRGFDEIIVIINNSTDRTRVLADNLLMDYPKVKLLNYSHKCSPIGPDYIERVKQYPDSSLAKYYNWCIDQTTFSHVCNWDGDMIAIPALEVVRKHIENYEVVIFDGYDVLGKDTTNQELRMFK